MLTRAAVELHSTRRADATTAQPAPLHASTPRAPGPLIARDTAASSVTCACSAATPSTSLVRHLSDSRMMWPLAGAALPPLPAGWVSRRSGSSSAASSSSRRSSSGSCAGANGGSGRGGAGVGARAISSVPALHRVLSQAVPLRTSSASSRSSVSAASMTATHGSPNSSPSSPASDAGGASTCGSSRSWCSSRIAAAGAAPAAEQRSVIGVIAGTRAPAGSSRLPGTECMHELQHMHACIACRGRLHAIRMSAGSRAPLNMPSSSVPMRSRLTLEPSATRTCSGDAVAAGQASRMHECAREPRAGEHKTAQHPARAQQPSRPCLPTAAPQPPQQRQQRRHPHHLIQRLCVPRPP